MKSDNLKSHQQHFLSKPPNIMFAYIFAYMVAISNDMYNYKSWMQVLTNFYKQIYKLRDHPLFSAFLQQYREYARGGDKSSCMLSKMLLVLAIVPVHETSLADQHFYSTLLGRREGVCEKSILCTLVKMLKIMDSPLVDWLKELCTINEAVLYIMK